MRLYLGLLLVSAICFCTCSDTPIEIAEMTEAVETCHNTPTLIDGGNLPISELTKIPPTGCTIPMANEIELGQSK